MTPRGPIALLGMLALAGCDPALRVRGLVRTDPSCGIAERPIAGAEILLVCTHDGKDHPMLLGASRDDGRFVLGMTGTLADHCHVRVEHPDFHPQIFRPTELCAMTSLFIDLEMCHGMAVDARLVPRSPGGTDR